MNSKERVLCALDHKEADRVPIGEWGIDHDTVERVIGHETYWRARKRSTLALWDGRRDEVVESEKNDIVELIGKLDQDLVPVFLVPPKDLEPKQITQIDDTTWKDQRGHTYKYSDGNDAILCTDYGATKKFNSAEELTEHFESAYVPSMGFRIKEKTPEGYTFELEDPSQMELVRFVVDKLGEERFIFGRCFDEFAFPFEYTFGEDFFLFMALQPDLAKLGFDLITELELAKAQLFIDAGVDAIMPGGDFSDSTGPMISPQNIRDIFLPGMKRLSEYCHKAGVRMMSHNCGNNWKIMDLLIEAGYECWQSIACKTADMDLKRLKEQYGDQIAFWGGINIETLVTGTPEENRADVRYALEHAAPGGGLILGTSNSVCYGSRYENYMAALETAHKYGAYPIEI